MSILYKGQQVTLLPRAAIAEKNGKDNFYFNGLSDGVYGRDGVCKGVISYVDDHMPKARACHKVIFDFTSSDGYLKRFNMLEDEFQEYYSTTPSKPAKHDVGWDWDKPHKEDIDWRAIDEEFAKSEMQKRYSKAELDSARFELMSLHGDVAVTMETKPKAMKPMMIEPEIHIPKIFKTIKLPNDEI